MRLKIAARQSDLARWQAVKVADHLKNELQHRLTAEPEFQFKSSLGDQNLDVPLASMGGKGVFTEDFYQDLTSGRCDLVVHSWKDLPTEERQDTTIAMTLERADVRDVLLVPNEVWSEACKTNHLTVLTSSPRRIYNLSSHLQELLPGNPKTKFENVRGNVPTRLKKMREQRAALILAKAGLDRLLEAEQKGFITNIRALIENCRFQILPISLNPPAPAQGALAVEITKANSQLLELCRAHSHTDTFNNVKRERELLRSYGGGCHQKIGAVYLTRPYGQVHSLAGITDAGEVLHRWSITSDGEWSKAKMADHVFPRHHEENRWFARNPRPIDSQNLAKESRLLVARAEAWPNLYTPQDHQLIWAAGVKTWKKLARLGIWVSGCQDGLGENEPMGLEFLLLGPSTSTSTSTGPQGFTKLTHGQAGSGLATYDLVPLATHPDLKDKTHFFWSSSTVYQRARDLYGDRIAQGFHASGPGATHEYLQAHLPPVARLKVFSGMEEFLRASLP